MEERNTKLNNYYRVSQLELLNNHLVFYEADIEIEPLFSAVWTRNIIEGSQSTCL